MASLKLKMLPVFPTKVLGTGGIGVNKESGVYTIEPEWDDLALALSISANNMQVWVRDATDSTYKRVALSTLIASITAPIFVQNDAPDTDETEGSIWIDADSTESDVYQLVSGVWTDTGADLKGPQGDQGDAGSKIFVQDSEPSTSEPDGSIWIDADSTNQDLYQLSSGSWGDTGVNVKGADGAMSGPGSAVVGNVATFSAVDGNTLADSGVAIADVVVDSDIANMLESGDIGVSVQGYDADTLKADTADDLTAGFTSASVDQGTKSSGTFTPAFAAGNVQHYTNGGAHTLAPPSSGNGSIIIDMTNDGSAGAVTTSGFTKVTGDALTTTNGHKFRFFITVGNAGSHLHKQAMQ